MHHRRRTVEPSVSITITPSAPSSQSKSHSLAAKQFKLTDNSAAATPEDAKLQKKLNERRNKCLELQDTEENYVSILNYIVQVSKLVQLHVLTTPLRGAMQLEICVTTTVDTL